MTPFDKIHACGNDFILLDEIPDSKRIETMCDRFHHVGADGVMVYEGQEQAEVRLRHFDRDGSASFCLNGTRAALACLIAQDKVPAAGAVRTEGVKMEYRHEKQTQVIAKKSPVQAMTWPTEEVSGYFCDVGNPHFIIHNGDHWQAFPQLAPRIRRDEQRFPDGSNVSILRPAGDAWRIRTFERGVEGITKACGSGIMAASLVLLHCGHEPPLRFLPDGADWVQVEDFGDTIGLQGPTGWVASGVLR